MPPKRMTDLTQHRRHRAPVSAVVVLLIDKKCDGGNNHYYSKCSHSKLPRYFVQPRCRDSLLRPQPNPLVGEFWAQPRFC